MQKIITLILATLLGLPFLSAQEDIFNLPNKQQLVIDNANEFSENEQLALTQKLNKFSYETSTQIVVYTTKDLQGYNIDDFNIYHCYHCHHDTLIPNESAPGYSCTYCGTETSPYN